MSSAAVSAPSVAEHEAQQVDRVNASGKTPVVLAFVRRYT
jgi:hypothetical protein